MGSRARFDRREVKGGRFQTELKQRQLLLVLWPQTDRDIFVDLVQKMLIEEEGGHLLVNEEELEDDAVQEHSRDDFAALL